MNVLHHDLVYPLLAGYRREYEDKLLAARRPGLRASKVIRVAPLLRFAARG